MNNMTTFYMVSYGNKEKQSKAVPKFTRERRKWMKVLTLVLVNNCIMNLNSTRVKSKASCVARLQKSWNHAVSKLISIINMKITRKGG